MALFFTSITDPKLAELLRDGAIGIIPTDTVYGLVGRAEHQSAIDRLYHVKEREQAPGTMIAHSVDALSSLGFPQEHLAQVAHHWPAPLSVVLDASEVADYLKRTRESLPVRIPNHPDLLELLAATGPLMTTSANTPHSPTSRTIDEAVAYFGDAVDFYVDAGDLGERPPSTIIGYDGNDIVVYREGAFDSSSLK